MRARKYGRGNVSRAAATANAFAASRLKNQTPGFPCAVTYVRTFNSGNAESPGSGGVHRSRTPLMEKGTMPSQARPSNVSMSSFAGMCGRNMAASTDQCANRRSCHDCAMIHGPDGSGHGRCTVRSSKEVTVCDAPLSTASPIQYTLREPYTLSKRQRIELPALQIVQK